MKLHEIPPKLLWLTITMIIANLASSMYFPLLPLYLESLGASTRDIGFFFTTVVVLSISFRILGGWISDTMGRLVTVALGGSIGMAAITFYTLAPTWELAIIGALFGEMGASLVGPSFQAYTAESAPEGKTSSTFGLVNGLFFICMIIGPLLGGFLAEYYGYKTMMWVATGIFVIATTMRIWLARGSNPQINFKALKPQKLVAEVRGLVGLFMLGGLLMWLFIIDGFLDAGFQLVIPFLPKYITDIGNLQESDYGALFALMALVAALVMWPAGKFADKYSERWAITLGIALMSCTWMLIVLQPTPWVFVIGFAIAGVGRAFVEPSFSALISKAVPKESLGITWGIFMTALGFLAIPAPYIGGWLYEEVDPTAPFIAAVMLSLAVVPLVLSRLRPTPTPEAPPTPILEPVVERA